MFAGWADKEQFPIQTIKYVKPVFETAPKQVCKYHMLTLLKWCMKYAIKSKIWSMPKIPRCDTDLEEILPTLSNSHSRQLQQQWSGKPDPKIFFILVPMLLLCCHCSTFWTLSIEIMQLQSRWQLLQVWGKVTKFDLSKYNKVYEKQQKDQENLLQLIYICSKVMHQNGGKFGSYKSSSLRYMFIFLKIIKNPHL